MSTISGLIALVCVFTGIVAQGHGVELHQNGKIITIAFTPYDDYGNLNLAMVPKLAKYYADNNLTNIFIMEFDGGGSILRLKERKALAKAWAEQGCSLRLNIIVEVGLQAFVDTLSLASYCSKLNVTAITHFPEQIYKADNIKEAIEDLKRVSEAAPNLPLIYNELLTTAPIISTDAVYLAGDEVPTFCGVETNINTYNDIEAATSQSTNNCSSNCNKKIWIYDIQNMYAAFLLGLSSVTLGPNLSPSIVKAMEAAADNCDRDTAKKMQNKLNSLVAATIDLNGGTINTYARIYFSYLKAGFQLITGMNVGARVPFKKANSTAYDEIASNLKSLGFTLADSASQ